MAKRDGWRGAHRAQHLVFEVARAAPRWSSLVGLSAATCSRVNSSRRQSVTLQLLTSMRWRAMEEETNKGFHLVFPASLHICCFHPLPLIR